MMKKTIAKLLVFVMLIMLFPFSATAGDMRNNSAMDDRAVIHQISAGGGGPSSRVLDLKGGSGTQSDPYIFGSEEYEIDNNALCTISFENNGRTVYLYKVDDDTTTTGIPVQQGGVSVGVTVAKDGTVNQTFKAAFPDKDYTYFTVKYKVILPVTDIALNKTYIRLTEGATVTLSATVTSQYEPNSDVNWATNDNSLATVSVSADNSKTATVTAVKSGFSTITAGITGADGKLVVATCVFEISSVPASSFTLNKTSVTLTEGTTETLTAIVPTEYGTNAGITWRSSDETIATVTADSGDSKTATVTVVGSGTADIFATITGETNLPGASCRFIASEKEPLPPIVNVDGVTLNTNALSLEAGQEKTLSANVTPVDASNKRVTWTIDDEEIVSIEKTNTVNSVMVKAKKVGTTKITVKTDDGNKTAECTVTVKEPKYTVTVITPQNGTLLVDPEKAVQGENITVTATPSEGYTLDTLAVTNAETGASVNITNGKFIMPAGNVTVTAVFKAKEDDKPAPTPVLYGVTVKALPEEGGTAKASVEKAEPGEEVTITFNANDGYAVKSITVNGKATEPIPENGTYPFAMPAGDVVAQVEFKLIDTKVDYEVETEATSEPVEIPEGAAIAEADENKVKEVANNTSMGAAEVAHKYAIEVVKDQSIVDKATNADTLKALGAEKAVDVEIIVKPVLAIIPQAYTGADAAKPILKFEIKGSLQVLAQKKGDNAPGKTTVELDKRPIEEPVEISIPLPFTDKVAFAAHSGKWQYAAEKNQNGIFTFVNPHGFSEFAFGVEDQTVVSNVRIKEAEGYTYLDFKAAAEDAKSGDVLILEKDSDVNVNLPDGVKVKLENNNIKFTGTINGKSVTLSTEAYTVSKAGSSSGGGGGSSKPSIKPGEKPVKPGATVPGGGVAGFNDVATSAWYADSVKYVVDKGLFGGVGNGNFAPEANMTRAMMWTVLARYKGVDTASGSNWYEAAQAWAQAQGISDGTKANENVNREQFVTMLWRLSGEPAVDSAANFTDGGKVSDYAKTAVTWAVSQGVVNGYGDGSFKPQGSATRAEVAKMLTVFCQKAETNA